VSGKNGPRGLSSPRQRESFAVDGLWIELAVRVHERQSRAAPACFDLSVKAGVSSGVAGSTGLLDPDPDRVLIAIQPHLDKTINTSPVPASVATQVTRPAASNLG
jgi:hypothetical protein